MSNSSQGLVILGWLGSSLKIKLISALHLQELCKYATNIAVNDTLGTIDRYKISLLRLHSVPA